MDSVTCSSTAQEESRSISANVTWGIRKAFSDGAVFLPYSHFLGYKKGENGLPEIVKEEAKIVRKIYALYLEGYSQGAIASYLIKEGIKTPGGKDKWTYSTIDSILKNEKYKGSARLQKKYTTDFLTKKTKKNEGEVPQYYVEDSHPGIIVPWEWDMVQAELFDRSQLPSKVRNNSPISGKLLCGDCGSTYGPKVWHSTSKYRKVIWQCNDKFNKEHEIKCSTPNIQEEDIKKLYLVALNEILGDKHMLIEDIREVKEKLFDADYHKEMVETSNDMKLINELYKKTIAEAATSDKGNEEYIDVYKDLAIRYLNAQKRLNDFMKLKYEKEMKSIQLDTFIKEIEELNQVELKFDNRLFNMTISKIVIYHDDTITFFFKNGKEVKLDIHKALE